MNRSKRLEKIVGVGIGIGIDSTGDIGIPISTAIPIPTPTPISGTVKLLLPPRQSRGISRRISRTNIGMVSIGLTYLLKYSLLYHLGYNTWMRG